MMLQLVGGKENFHKFQALRSRKPCTFGTIEMIIKIVVYVNARAYLKLLENNWISASELYLLNLSWVFIF